jgi:hypothetical protein
MDSYRMAGNVLKYPLVSSGLSSQVVIGLKTVYRDHKVKLMYARPFGGYLPHRARYKLHLDTHTAQLGQNMVELSEAHERLAAYNRYMNGPVAPRKRQHALNQSISLVIRKRAQRS